MGRATVRGKGVAAAAVVLSGALLLGVAACGGDAGATEPGTVRVVASTNVWGDIASAIGGPHAQVTSLITDPSADPHEFQASARTRLEVSRADVVIENGGGYDDFLRQLISAGTKATVIDAVSVSGAAARAQAAGSPLNEHVWYDLPSVGKVADRIATALATADPGDAAAFRANAAAFSGKLQQLIDREQAERRTTEGAPVAVTEPLPGYLLDALGAVDRTPRAFSTAVEDGNDVPVTVLRRTLALFSDHEVKALVYNAQTADPQTEELKQAARAAGVPVVPVTEILPPGKSYLQWMADNLTAISEALS